ncbi:MAG: hypothetical protein Ct9H90mP16_05580 [Candidatus Poseidoniales archaeon]|nr:MAG: hypothetical protein Ct9H90mP16_05580 [Candidatus Poseidoniales archaeon]
MAEMWISMGPQHPMTHGLWTLKVKIDGETVVDTEPDLGYIHRGVKKFVKLEISLKSRRTVTDFVTPVQTHGHTLTSTQPKIFSRSRYRSVQSTFE